jgi:hypothetical protein
LEGHLLAPLLEPNPPAFPFLALLVSGGHTQLIDVAGLGAYRILGETLDDAAGEAFDKTAKLLGLPYPGGAALAALAEESRSERFVFPRPMLDRPGLDFSFSGLKTAALVALRGRGQDPGVGAGIARAVSRKRWSRHWPKNAAARWLKPATGVWSSPAASGRIGACGNGWRRWSSPSARSCISRAPSFAPTMAQ